ncbi:hypothetical protein DFH94DRAFT_681414 [Russula ochroleuca]|uniref:Uncharacterized protein n=1 Tax=Russula ochroleuca TaxID=152965 RepID=A0A9P5MWM8_9AGAM|nr:hypothetical protein DFH94DRAFT_681414 [Russula ochroleuca]
MTRVAWGKMKRGVTVWAVLKTVAGQQGSEWGSSRFGDPPMKNKLGTGERGKVERGAMRPPSLGWAWKRLLYPFHSKTFDAIKGNLVHITSLVKHILTVRVRACMGKGINARESAVVAAYCRWRIKTRGESILP